MIVIQPCDLGEANAFVRAKHRHHKTVPGAKFCIAAATDEVVVGVAIIGRPVARMVDDGRTLEVTRLCTDGTRNACSILYAAAWRATRAMGYGRLITYTLPEEGGTSLRAAGWKLIGRSGRRFMESPIKAASRYTPNTEEIALGDGSMRTKYGNRATGGYQ